MHEGAKRNLAEIFEKFLAHRRDERADDGWINGWIDEPSTARDFAAWAIDAFPPSSEQVWAGLQIRGLKFQSSNSNSRELELTNLLGLVLGFIEAKFCK